MFDLSILNVCHLKFCMMIRLDVGKICARSITNVDKRSFAVANLLVTTVR